MPISLDEMLAVLGPYSAAITPDEYNNINTYIDLLLFWNSKISLTAVTDPVQILRFHFGESLFALNLAQFNHGRLADVGSGAGFPALAIKIFRPHLSMTLLEPNKKKCAFLNEVVRQLDCRDVSVVSSRYKNAAIGTGQLSFVTSRALGNPLEISNWARGVLASQGMLCVWLAETDAITLKNESGWQWSGPSLIPGTKGRMILIGSKV